MNETILTNECLEYEFIYEKVTDFLGLETNELRYQIIYLTPNAHIPAVVNIIEQECIINKVMIETLEELNSFSLYNHVGETHDSECEETTGSVLNTSANSTHKQFLTGDDE